jgi:hypothetical protein
MASMGTDKVQNGHVGFNLSRSLLQEMQDAGEPANGAAGSTSMQE